MIDPLLSLTEIVVDYGVGDGATRAVDRVTLSLAPGEIVGLVGESGSGKSTVGKVVAGFQAPTSGSYLVEGEPQYTRRRRNAVGSRSIQMIFQNSTTALNQRLDVAASVAEGIAKGGRITPRHRAQAAEYLQRVGLTEAHGDRKPYELSGGQRQRVAIARALAVQPPVLVCDEAVSALDVSSRAKILNLLIKIRREDRTAMLFISHDLAVVSQLVDRVLVMNKGRIVEEGPVREVIDRPQDEYTKRLLAAIPRLERTPAFADPTARRTS